MTGSKQKVQSLVVICFLVVIAIAFFGKVIYSGDTLYGSDFLLYFYPIKRFVYDYFCTNGSLPFWNSNLFSGTPFIANIQASMFYPLGFLYYLLPTEIAYLYATILHCILGAVFMYMLMRTVSVSKAGAFVSGFIFIFNGYFMAHLYAGHLTFVQNYIWIPLIFLFLIRFMRTGSFKYAVVAGMGLGIQILGGFPQIAFYTILAIMAYVLFFAVGRIRKGKPESAMGSAMAVVIILCVGFGLAAVQVLPTLEFSGLSGRAGGVNYGFATSDSLDFGDLFAFLSPEIFGNAIDHTYWKSPERWHFWETCAYVGLLPLLLIFVKIESGRLRRLRLFCIILICGAMFVAFGKNNPFYPMVYQLPGFGSFRIPAQIIFLYIFGIAVLAGMGLDRLGDSDVMLSKWFAPFIFFAGGLLFFLLIGLYFFPNALFYYLFKTFSSGDVSNINMGELYVKTCLSVQKSILVLFGSVLLILFRKSQKLNLRVFKAMAIAIIFVDLWLFSGGFIRPCQIETGPVKKELISGLNKCPAQGRVAAWGDLFMPNDGLRYEFPSILGYDPLILKRYIKYFETSRNRPSNDHVIVLFQMKDPGAKLLHLLNVTQAVPKKEIIFVENNPIPYANFVGHALVKNTDEVLPFMKSEAFDPSKMVIFEREYAPGCLPEAGTESPEGSFTIMAYENHAIRLKTSSDRAGFLVLSEIFYPGWQATVDGEKVPVFRGNYIFRVIPLNGGEHDVVFEFVSRPFQIGAIISSLTFLVSLLFFVRRKR